VVDSVLMRVVDLMQSVPRFLLAIVVVSLLGSGQEKLVLLLGLTSWTFLARLVRAEVLSMKRREFVEAARAAGAGDLRVLLRHVLPNVLPAVVVVLPLFASRIVLIEAGLAFLGLTDPARVSLGFLISEAQPHLQYYWWLSVFPGLALVTLVLGLNLVGDAVNDVLNPTATSARRARR
jgi:peptide/nickel transport system permease protein